MKLFVLLPRFPFPLDKGDRVRAYHQVLELARRHDVVVCALSHAPVGAAQRAALERPGLRVEVVRLGALGSVWGLARAWVRGLPLQVGYFLSQRARRRVLEVLAETRPDRVLVQLVRAAEYLRDVQVPKVLDYMDAFSWGLEQRVAHAGLLAPLLRFEARRLRRYERAIAPAFAACTVICETDRQQLALPSQPGPHVVGNGVDLDVFRPRPSARDVELLFVGNMAYEPNVLAAERLVREVLPRVRSVRPARVLIAGTRPTWRVRRLAGDGVTVSGWVDDVVACYARAQVFVAPMPVGTGLQNKLLQAMAMELPCVTSLAARRALGADEAHMQAADDVPGLAAHVLALLADPQAAIALGRRGAAFVRRCHAWGDTVTQLERVLLQAHACGARPDGLQERAP